jgi:hypothetical protein
MFLPCIFSLDFPRFSMWEWSIWQCRPFWLLLISFCHRSMHSPAIETSDKLGLHTTWIMGDCMHIHLFSTSSSYPVLPFQCLGQREMDTMFCSEIWSHGNFTGLPLVQILPLLLINRLFFNNLCKFYNFCLVDTEAIPSFLCPQSSIHFPSLLVDQMKPDV